MSKHAAMACPAGSLDRVFPVRASLPTSNGVTAAQPHGQLTPDSISSVAPEYVREARVVQFPGARLTARERRVLELMADGCEQREIARSLSASEGSFVSSESAKYTETKGPGVPRS